MTAAAPCAIRSVLRHAEGSEIDTSPAICWAYKVCNQINEGILKKFSIYHA